MCMGRTARKGNQKGSQEGRVHKLNRLIREGFTLKVTSGKHMKELKKGSRACTAVLQALRGVRGGRVRVRDSETGVRACRAGARTWLLRQVNESHRGILSREVTLLDLCFHGTPLGGY